MPGMAGFVFSGGIVLRITERSEVILLYAIGEIIRVVIGALQALRIHNRNEKSKDRTMIEENSLNFMGDGVS